MAIEHVQLSDVLIEFRDGGPNPWRIEMGPKTKTAVATEELLSNDVTAGHYQVGRPDALGKTIVLGEEMTYHDWLPHGERDWKVYKWDGERWQKVATKDSQLEAAAEVFSGMLAAQHSA